LKDIIEAVLKKDRTILIISITVIIALSWGYMFYLAGSMSSPEMVMVNPAPRIWNSTDLIFIFVMWAVMMIAMMLPSATPMLLMFSKVNRKDKQLRQPIFLTAIFLLGYLTVWTGFSLLATLFQWYLHNVSLLSSMMVSNNPVFGGVLLVSTGIFQFTSLKKACLNHCRSPLGFLLNEWKDGKSGAFYMGFKHGIFCVGCCWLLMSLLFVTGVMNLLWVAIIAVYVLIEKIIPSGRFVSRATGLIIILYGIWLFSKNFIYQF